VRIRIRGERGPTEREEGGSFSAGTDDEGERAEGGGGLDEEGKEGKE
jgi:hypothetical protein